MWIQVRLSRIVFEGLTLQQGDVGVWARSWRPCLHVQVLDLPLGHGHGAL